MNSFKDFLSKIAFGRSATLGVIFLFAFSVFCAFAYSPVAIFAFIFTLAYIILITTLNYFRSQGKDNEDSDRSLISSISKDFLTKTDYAISLIDDKNEIIWCNSGFSAIFGKGLYGNNIFEIIGGDFTDEVILSIKNGEIVPCTVGSSHYEMHGYPTSSYKKNGFYIILDNTNEKEALKHKLLMKRSVVALLVIDNFAEVVRFMGDNQRTVLSLIGNVLDNWNAKISGIIKEYEKNNYLIVFEEEQLEKIIEGKFEILDSIKEIEAEGINIPFTASIGVARTDGTFEEKLALARSALDLALARGGDQAVVKTDKTTEFFGGKLKSVQKRTKIRSRVIAEELQNLIRESGNVIIMGHRFCDHDSIGSCVGIAKLATTLGKETHIIINIHDANLKPIFATMRGKTEFLDLFTDSVAAQDYIRSDSLVIVCDVNNPAQFEAPEIFESAENIVIIDHHRKTSDYKVEPRIAYIEPSSSSASELVSEILEHSLEGGSLSPYEADLLLSGIILDTKQFSKNTGVRTFGVAQYLRSEGGSTIEAQKFFRTDIRDFMREARFESDIKIHFDSVAISKFTGETEITDKIAMAKAADRLLGVTSIKAAFIMSVIDNKVCISARSDGTINVQLILEQLGGGGHYDAAAAQMSDISLDEAEQKLLEACASYLNK